MSELAIVSARKSRLQELRDRGSRGAAAALTLAENPNRFLATVQIGITMVGIVSGAYGGVTIGEELGAVLSDHPWLGEHGEAVGVSSVIVLITFASLIVGELVPKRIALRYGETIAATVAIPMAGLATMSAPVVWLLSVCTDGLLRLLRMGSDAPSAVTDEEVRLLVREGTQAGVFEAAEQDMIEGVLGLDRQRVGEIMTPRGRMVWLDVNAPQDVVEDAIRSTGFSRIPVCEGTADHVRGFVKAREVLELLADHRPVAMETLLQKAPFLPESATALEALRAFRNTRTKMAFVVDEYGGVGGLISLTDVLEDLVGEEVMAESDSDGGIVQRDENSFLVDGMLPITVFAEEFELPIDEDSPPQYHTLAGLVLQQIGAIPQAGATFDWSGLHFEVVDMDGHRVDKVIVTRLPRDEMD